MRNGVRKLETEISGWAVEKVYRAFPFAFGGGCDVLYRNRWVPICTRQKCKRNL